MNIQGPDESVTGGRSHTEKGVSNRLTKEDTVDYSFKLASLSGLLSSGNGDFDGRSIRNALPIVHETADRRDVLGK